VERAGLAEFDLEHDRALRPGAFPEAGILAVVDAPTARTVVRLRDFVSHRELDLLVPGAGPFAAALAPSG
jgi:hypothetical protein